MNLLLTIAAGAGCFCLGLLVLRLLSSRRLRLLAALSALQRADAPPEAEPAAARPRRGGGVRALGKRAGRFFLRGPAQSWAERSLRGSGLPLRPEEFLALTAGGLVAGWLVGTLLPITAVVRILLIVIGPLIPSLLVRRARTKRITAISSQMGDVLNTLGNGLRAGHSLMQALDAASTQIAAPLGEEVGRLLRETSSGIPMDEALSRMIARSANPDLELMVTAIRVQREVGGNLAEVLDRISGTIRARVAVKNHLQVVTAQSRMSAWVVGLLPVGVFALTTVVAPQVSETLVRQPLGRVLAVVAVILELIGVAAIRRIVAIKY